MEATFIQILGFTVQDPMTLLTDVILGGQCLFFAWKLWVAHKSTTTARGFVWFFLLLGLGSLEGGIVNHGIFYMTGPGWKFPMVLLVGTSVSFLMIGNLASMPGFAIHPVVRRVLLTFVFVEYCLFLWFLSNFPREAIDFKTLIPHLAIGLILFVSLLQLYGQFRSPGPGRLWMLAGVAAVLPAGLITILRISPDRWFNMYDLVHVILLVPMYLFYRAGLEFGAAEKKEPFHGDEMTLS